MLDSGETVVAEAGVMNYMDDGITFEFGIGGGFQANSGMMGKLMNMGKRMLDGESLLPKKSPGPAFSGEGFFLGMPGDLIDGDNR
jgi:uncharacterized protein (AIM24 family)